MSKKSNVHPDHYKTDGRDRPDDAARARLNRAIAAKSLSQQRPDRMGKEFYFERPEPASPAPPEPAARKKPAAGAARRRPRAKAAAPRIAAKGPKRRSSAKRKAASSTRPAKKR